MPSTAQVDKKALEEGVNISLLFPACIFIHPLKSDIPLYNKMRCVYMSVCGNFNSSENKDRCLKTRL
jgi:hypothetical protein